NSDLVLEAVSCLGRNLTTFFAGSSTMYRPNFCSECGVKILRLHWHSWTSRRFCDSCSKRLLKQRLTIPLIAAITLLSIGLITGRARRPAPPPLIIERSANSPLYKSQNNGATNESPDIPANAESTNSHPPQNSQATTDEELVYICGARTKKGTPCARRVHSAVRCWQHKGSRAMLPPEKLVLKD
ncbi:MAG: hypothetical protein M3Q91_05795, partial [Acidobacteriota bacterium]|nr:hypothetical protein [Acidobacteriota bacterium]